MLKASENTRNLTMNLPAVYRERFDRLALAADFKNWRDGKWTPAPSSFIRKLVMDYIDRELPNLERKEKLQQEKQTVAAGRIEISRDLVPRQQEEEEKEEAEKH